MRIKADEMASLI